MYEKPNYKLSAEPLVSVIIANFNGGRKLINAVNSILNQTYKKLECIVVDDCSTDESLQLLGELKDKRLRVVQLDENGGSFVAANAGIDVAEGELIARLDADDLSFPNRIRYQVEKFKKNPALILLGGKLIQTDLEGNFKSILGYGADEDGTFARMLTGYTVWHSTMMFRSHYPDGEKIKYNPARVASDFALCLDLVLKGEVRSCDMFLGTWEKGSSNITAKHSDVQVKVSTEARKKLAERLNYESTCVRRAIITHLGHHLENEKVGWLMLDKMLKYVEDDDWSELKMNRYVYGEIKASDYPNLKKVLYLYCKHSPIKNTAMLLGYASVLKVAEKLKLQQSSS